MWRLAIRARHGALPLSASSWRQQQQLLLVSTDRCFSSAYEGDVSDVLRFDCIYPSVHTLQPKHLLGRVVLVVNTASHCTNATAQLTALQQLYDKYESKGLLIIAVPSNDFDKKEPAGSDQELLMKYTSEDGDFKVKFCITKKTTVVGDQAHAFFDRIAKKYGRSVAPTWNFDKFLVDAYGDLSAVFPHDTDPSEPEVSESIEEALAEIPSVDELDGSDDEEQDEEDEDDEETDDEEEEKKKKKGPPSQKKKNL